MDFFSMIIRFFQDGGYFMYPIAIVLVFGWAIALERWFFLTTSKVSNRKAFDTLMPLVKRKDFSAIAATVKGSKTPMHLIVGAGISRLGVQQRRDEIEMAMEERVMEATPRIQRRTAYLGVLANSATLLGLLGTIMGLIAAFEAVAGADPAEKATLLAQSISIAMNTTAFGLIAAIPLLLVHSFLQHKTAEVIDSLEMASVKVLNMIGDMQKTATKSRAGDA